jgi:hypothetical protein
MDLKTFTPTFKRDPGLPSGVWDPAWQRPEVASRVAADAYLTLRYAQDDFGPDALQDGAALPQLSDRYTEERRFALGEAKTFDDSPTRLRGGSYGEIFKRYTYGGTRPAVNFHAQAVSFGVDSQGRYFLKGILGRVDGAWGNRAALICRFLAGERCVGGLSFQCELDPPQDVPFLLSGTSPRLAREFDAIDCAQLTFFAKSG